jgi:metal-sulfur cluster biosynthetic enzyme
MTDAHADPVPPGEPNPAGGGAHPGGTTGGAIDTEAVQAACIEALKVVRDPEIPVNIVDLGLVYQLEVDDDGAVEVEMTLTSMGCPVQDMIQADVELACMKVDGVSRVNVAFVWSPAWSTDKMTDDGKKQMRMFGFHV